ncbi:D-alanyl-D-alanine dipeptidase [Amorphus suaedae]
MRGWTCALLFLALAAPAMASDLPDGFVHLADVAPTVRQEMRYAGPDNFIGAPVPGYEAPACILTRPAAEGLSRVQAGLKPKGYSLIVYDCYRPARAVAAFVDWTQSDAPGDRYFYPEIDKARLIPDGYIADRSGHSRGSTVDLAIVPLTMPDKAPPARPERCDASSASSTVIELGTDYDCFSPLSATASTEVSAEAQANRRILLEAMTAAGFRNLAEEWWHYTLRDEPFPDTYFEFDVE